MEHDPNQPARPASDIEPDDAVPDEGVDAPEPSKPDPDHVVEEKQKSD